MKNKYTPVLIIIMIFGFVWVFLLAKAGTERVKGESIMNKKTMVVEADKNAIPPDMETAIFAAGCFWGVRIFISFYHHCFLIHNTFSFHPLRPGFGE